MSPAGWRELIDELLFEGLLKEDPNDNRPVIGLGDADAVRAVYRGERRVMLREPPAGADASTRSGAPRRRTARAGRGGEAVALASHDQPLFEALRAWRKTQAAAQGVPPYVIFHDRTLAEIARLRPDQPAGAGGDQRRRRGQARAVWRGGAGGAASERSGSGRRS